MDLKHLTPVLFVKDAIRSRDFYVQVLQLTEIMNNGDLNFVFDEGLAVWQTHPENIIPQKLGLDKITDTDAPPRSEIVFETGDIDEVYDTVKKAGVRFLHEMNTEIWGQRTIRFYDPDGHLIEVGESLPVFIRRIWEEEGRDVEAASERTYTPVEVIEQVLGL